MPALRVTQRRDALAERGQALIDRAKLFHLDILAHVRVAVFLTPGQVDDSQDACQASLAERVGHLDLEDRVASTRCGVLAGRADLSILETFLQLDVGLLPSIHYDFLEVVDDKVTVFLFSDIKTLTLHRSRVSIFSTAS